mgnify:CR=1 FL=1|jgi:surface carbohydrate biosynthesis protein
MKRLKLISKRKIDLLIVDEVGSDALKYCLPDHMSYSILPVRNVIPLLLSIKFLNKFFIKIINNENIRYSALYSIVEVLSPDVIISLIDNSERNGKLQEFFPNKLVISIQNGLRSGKYPFPNNVPVLYGFGDYENDLLISINARFREYNPVGSLRFGIFMDEYAKSCEERKYDICYVSQFSWRVNIGKIDMTPVMEFEKKIYSKIVCICQKKGYSLSVAMRNPTNLVVEGNDVYLQELQYFHNMDKQNYAVYVGNRVEKYTSYCLALASSIVLGVSSTLLYEMFGYGKKVLFLGSGSMKLQDRAKIKMNFSKLPEDVCIRSMDTDHIEYKISNLIQKEQNEYLSSISDAQINYMNYGKEFAHHIIKERIRSFVNEQST